VVSTDFSHHGRGYSWAPFPNDGRLGDRLLELGTRTAERVAAVDPDGFWQQVEVSGDTVCGKRPVGIVTELLDHAFEGSGRVDGVTTSGHVSGSFEQSVTYAAMSFDGKWTSWRDEPAEPKLGQLSDAEKTAVLELARATLKTHLLHDSSLAEWYAGHVVEGSLAATSGAFVTMHNQGKKARKHGRLRACMGVIEAREPLVDAVIHSAVSAAHDPRFPELSAAELDEIHLEVSILSPPEAVSSAREIEVGTHGVLLHKSGRSAVFLPQVAPEQGWDRDTMLDHLSRKAGLSRDAWRSGATFEVFTAEVFAEPE
jgi:AmmeMemoRadiSam system protein A